LKNVRFLFSDL
jgi:hypothetical protein